MKPAKHRISKVRTISLVSGLVLTGVVVATAAIPWLRFADESSPNPPVAAIGLNEQRAASSRTTEAESAPGPKSGVASPDPANPNWLSRDRLVGTWQLEKHGQRTLTILPDGQATAEVRLDLLGAFLYGSELTLELTWTLESGVMTQTVTGGRPSEAVARLIRDWGDVRQYRVLEVTEEELILAELDDDNDREVWTAAAHTSEEH